MKKWLSGWLLPLVAIMCMFSACPNGETEGEEEEGKKGTGDKVPKPVITASGAYVEGTIIEMDSDTNDMVIYYTLDGSVPTTASIEYSLSTMPKMNFVGQNPITVKAIAAQEGFADSDVVEAVYTRFEAALSTKVQQLADQIKADSKGNSAQNPVEVVIPADFTLEDVLLSFQNYNNPRQKVTDGLGQIYAAFGGKYVALDLSNTNWTVSDDYDKQVKGIPDISHSEGTGVRPDKDKVVSIKFPADVVYISGRAFYESSGLTKIDFTGLSKLEAIAAYAFYNNRNVEEIIFTGCTGLKVIRDHAFTYPHKVKYLDFEPCTSLEEIESYTFSEPRSAKYIEFPKNLKNIGDYTFRDGYSLEYVRYHSQVAPWSGWCTFNYHDWQHTWNGTGEISKEYNGLTSIHRTEGVDGEFSDRTDHMFVIYHPQDLTYTRGRGGYYTADDDGYYFVGQNVPETTPGAKGSSDDKEFRGLSSVTITASGLDSTYNGKTLSTNVGSQTATVNNGTVTITLNTPDSTKLRTLDQETGQDLTGKYGEKPNIPSIAGGYKSDLNDNWSGGVYGTNSGVLGKPWISDPTTKFEILELSIDGKKLVRTAKGQYTDPWNAAINTRRTVRYMYVDKDVVITRMMRGEFNLPTVSLSLKAGWNLIEQRDSLGAEDKVSQMALWITGGIIEKDPAKTYKADEGNETREIPWVIE